MPKLECAEHEVQITPPAATSGPVTVRTPHDATRDCFSISIPIVCRRSMRLHARDIGAEQDVAQRDLRAAGAWPRADRRATRNGLVSSNL